MERNVLVLVSSLLVFAASFPFPAKGESLSWSPVNSYTDGTPIAPATVSYLAYWTLNPGLTTGLNSIGSTVTNSITFNIDTLGMPRGSTIYFTCRSRVNGSDSALSSPYAWQVPNVVPPPPAQTPLPPSIITIN
jgi:hypothetical protein